MTTMELQTLIREGTAFARPRAAAAAAAAATPRWSLRAEGQGAAHLYLYDSIGWPGIEAREVVDQLRGLSRRPLQVHLNSPGGDVFAGLAIHNALRTYGAPVDIRVEGLAASIASVIAMSGSTLRMATASMLMIHEPHGFVMGDAHDMRHMAGLLEKAGGVMVDVYAKRGVDPTKIRQWMHAETWWSAKQALEAGLIDALDDEPIPADAAAARASFDLSGFRRPPGADPAPAAPAPVPRTRERARLLAQGFDLLVGAA